MKPENEHDNIAQALAPYAPPQTTGESVPLDADGQPLDYRAIAVLIRTVLYCRRIQLLNVFFIGMVTPFVLVLYCTSFSDVLMFVGLLAGGAALLAMLISQRREYKTLIELEDKSGYHFSWLSWSSDPVPYALKLLRQAGYRAERFFLPDLSQFDTTNQPTQE